MSKLLLPVSSKIGSKRERFTTKDFLVFSVTVLPEQGKIVQVEARHSSRTVVNREGKYYCGDAGCKWKWHFMTLGT